MYPTNLRHHHGHFQVSSGTDADFTWSKQILDIKTLIAIPSYLWKVTTTITIVSGNRCTLRLFTWLIFLYIITTRMHSSRMRTARSSSHRGGGLVLIPLNFPLGCWPRPDPPQFPPLVWAWIWSPSISPLGVGLDLIPLNFPLGCGPGPDPPQFPPWVWAWQGGVSLAGGVSQHALRQTPP